MAICDLNTGLGKLTVSAKRLRQQWEQVRVHWDDQNALDFEQNHLQPLKPQLALTTAAVHRLAELLAQIERDCSDSEGIEGSRCQLL